MDDNVITWQAIENARGYVVSVNGVNGAIQSSLSYSISDTTPGDYVISVKAVASDENLYTDSVFSSQVTYTVQSVIELSSTTLWVVGDSTVSSFDDQYYYPRYGYGTQLSNYFSDKVTIKNLALAGRSSKSFLNEANYTTLKSGIKAGDYLMIGFDEAKKYHAVTQSMYDRNNQIVANYDTVDGTHINMYGANFIDYLIATELKKTTNSLKNYVKNDITEPTIDILKAKDILPPSYKAPNLADFIPAIDNYKTISNGWYGTAMGE